ncbi:MAG: hypothetical protein LBK25_02780 [Treponema sp.]|jgi:hypothetical protein|nr:hypothetical protein [Treponema sp.]
MQYSKAHSSVEISLESSLVSPRVSFIIGGICIAVYIAAVVFAGVMIFKNMNEQHQTAQKEFDKLVVYTQSLNLDFMTEPFQSAFSKTLALSKPLSAVIVSSGTGEYAFENTREAGIEWNDSKPSFKKSFLISTDELVSPLPIANQRNVTIRAAYDRVDYTSTTTVLKQSLFAVLLALCVSFFTFLLRLLLSRDTVSLETRADNVLDDIIMQEEEVVSGDIFDEEIMNDDMELMPDNDDIIMPELSEEELAGLTAEEMDTPFLGIGNEFELTEKLTNELERSQTFNQDLTVMAMESRKEHFAEDVIDFFVLKDIIFEITLGRKKEEPEHYIDVIASGVTIDEGFHKASDFRNTFLSKYPEQEVFIGLSSRSGREEIDAERLLMEAKNALWNAEKDSPVVAFRVDPEKYKEWLKNKENSES